MLWQEWSRKRCRGFVVWFVGSAPTHRLKTKIRRGASEERSSAEDLLSTNVSNENWDEEQSVDYIKDKRTKEPER